MSLLCLELPAYGPVWASGRRRDDLKKLADEVDEYFALGLELPRGATVIDVGANIGMFAIAAAARVPDVRLIGIEPIPILHQALEKNVAENPHFSKAHIRLIRRGLSKDDSEPVVEFAYFSNFPSDSTRYLDGKRVEFERAFETFGKNFDQRVSGTIPGPIGRGLGSMVGSLVKGLPVGRVGRWMSDRVTGIEKVRCEMTTLASVIDEVDGVVDVLKIDVEGAEIDVIAGARMDQWARVRQVVLEANDLDGRRERVCAMLRERGLTKQVIAEPALSLQQDLRSFLLLASREDASAE
jgi:FkbM family methyltransferase